MVAVDAGKPAKLLAAEGVEKYVQADTGAGGGNASDLNLGEAASCPGADVMGPLSLRAKTRLPRARAPRRLLQQHPSKVRPSWISRSGTTKAQPSPSLPPVPSLPTHG